MRREFFEILQILDWPESGQSVLGEIDSSMFSIQDIESVEYTKNGSFVVRVYGLNGVLPSRYFDDLARQKVLDCVKIKQSPLWRAINELS